MKAKKRITMVTLILIVAIISVASFGGIYWQKEYKVVNVLPDYVLGMEFKDSRIINLEADKTATKTIYDSEGNIVLDVDDSTEYTEENGYTVVESKANNDEDLNENNYDKTKSILKSRLKGLEVDQYTISLDKETGNISIRIPENDKTVSIMDNLLKSGTFELTDTDTGEVLIDTSKVDDAKVVYGTTETGTTTVYLQIEFDKEGTAKLEEISQIYKKVPVQKEEGTEENETENESEDDASTEIKYVTVALSEEIVMTTYFGEKLSNGVLNIPIGSSNDSEKIQEYLIKGNQYANILNSGKLPITYTQTTSEISHSSITSEQINTGIYIAIGITALMIIILIIRFKLKGLFAGLLQIGFIALLLLAVRYANVKITIEGIGGLVLSAIMNYAFIYMSFKNFDLDFMKDTTKKIAISLIPVYIISIILSFNSSANIYSIGMTIVWGIITMYLYNLTITKIGIKALKE